MRDWARWDLVEVVKSTKGTDTEDGQPTQDVAVSMWNTQDGEVFMNDLRQRLTKFAADHGKDFTGSVSIESANIKWPGADPWLVCFKFSASQSDVEESKRYFPPVVVNALKVF